MLQSNMLSGCIPGVLGALLKMATFMAFHNELRGAVPHAFGSVSDASYLMLSFK